jgi:hypothetical protein
LERSRIELRKIQDVYNNELTRIGAPLSGEQKVKLAIAMYEVYRFPPADLPSRSEEKSGGIGSGGVTALDETLITYMEPDLTEEQYQYFMKLFRVNAQR